jgi:hypothetical protein
LFTNIQTSYRDDETYDDCYERELISHLVNIDFKNSIDLVDLANSNNFELTEEEEESVCNVT